MPRNRLRWTDVTVEERFERYGMGDGMDNASFGDGGERSLAVLERTEEAADWKERRSTIVNLMVEVTRRL